MLNGLKQVVYPVPSFRIRDFELCDVTNMTP